MPKRNISLVALITVAIAFSGAYGQWLEKTILFPDSLGGAIDPTCLAYDSVNNVVYVGGGDAVQVVDARSWQTVARIPVEKPVNALCFAPNYNKLYCLHNIYHADGWLTVIDCGSRSVIGMINVGKDLTRFSYSPAFGKLYCVRRDTVSVISVANDSIIKTLKVGFPYLLQHNPANNRVYVACRYTVTVIDEATDSIVAQVNWYLWPRAMCFNSSGSKLYVAGTCEVAVIDTRTDSLLDTLFIDAGREIEDICYSQAFDRVFCVCGYPGTSGRLYIIDALVDSVLGWVRLRRRYPPMCIECNEASGKIYLSAYSSPSGVMVYDATTMTQDTIIEVGVVVMDMLNVPSLHRLLCVADQSKLLSVLDTQADTIITHLPLGGSTYLATYSPSVHKLYVGACGGLGGRIYIVDPVLNQVVKTIDARPNALFFNESNNRLYVASNPPDTGIKVYDGYTDSLMKFIPLPYGVGGFLHHPRRNKLYGFAGGADVTVIDANRDTFVTWIDAPGVMQHFALVPDYNKLYLFLEYSVAVVDCSLDIIVSYIPMETGKDENTCYVPAPPRLYWAQGDYLHVIDVKKDTVVKSIRRPCGDYHHGWLYYIHDRRKLYWIPYNINEQWDMIVVVDVNTDSVVGTHFFDKGRGGEMWLDHTGNYLYMVGRKDDFNVDESYLTVFDCRKESIVCSFTLPDGDCMRIVPNYEHRYLYIPSINSRLFVIRDTITFGCAEAEQVSIPPKGPTVVRSLSALGRLNGTRELFDVTGRKIISAPDGRFETKITPTGVYFLREGYRITKLIILK